jgi:hypothetical protein
MSILDSETVGIEVAVRREGKSLGRRGENLIRREGDCAAFTSGGANKQKENREVVVMSTDSRALSANQQ